MAHTTTNMGLIGWDLPTDPYDHSQLSSNMDAVDSHDHTTGKGVQIPTGGIVDGAISSVKLATNSVSTTKVQDHAITRVKLAFDSVGGTEIIDGSITTTEIADGSITAVKLESGLFSIGDVKMWYRPNTGIAIPTGAGWEVADGRAWSTVTNAYGLSSGNMPDLRNKFILGAATTNIGSGPTNNPDIGQVGGAHTVTVSHSHNVNSHTHSIPGHTHTISSDGSHSHSIASDGDHSHSIHSRLNAFLQGLEFVDSTSNVRHNTLQSLYVAGFNNGSTDDPIPVSGAHTHGGSTGAAGTHTHGGATGSTSGTTDAGSSTTDAVDIFIDKRSAYVGLLFLIKVR